MPRTVVAASTDAVNDRYSRPMGTYCLFSDLLSSSSMHLAAGRTKQLLGFSVE